MSPKRIPDERLKQSLLELAEELDRTPTADEMQERGEHSPNTFRRRFGSWNEAVKAAGLSPNDPPKSRKND